MVVMDPRQRVNGVDPVREQGRNHGLAGGHPDAPLRCDLPGRAAVFLLVFAMIPYGTVSGPQNADRGGPVEAVACLDKARPPCAFPAPPAHISATNRPKDHACTVTAPIPAARSARAISAQTVRLSGWVHRIRDHGGVLFIDLRDHYGLTQVVADPDSPAFKDAEKLRSEWVVRIDGKVRKRPAGTENPELPTGHDRSIRDRDRGAGPGGRIADAGVRRSGISGGHPAALPLPRSAARAAAQQHHDARADHRFDPRAA